MEYHSRITTALPVRALLSARARACGPVPSAPPIHARSPPCHVSAMLRIGLRAWCVRDVDLGLVGECKREGRYPRGLKSREYSREYTLTFATSLVALGGKVVCKKADLDKAAFFFCDSAWDTDFIARLYDTTYRVLTKTYIFDCTAEGCRLCEETYSWSVSEENTVQATFSLVKWSGPLKSATQKAREAAKIQAKERESVLENQAERRPMKSLPRRTGLLTPAPSLTRS
ncbi:hypothetical protein C8J57DRAFT_1515893 [Mycena rebaudengoi]|nr:hypothetical protein C8J57DRAFT_1515893 [Mycena rebaudengoi]